ncbi:MAG: DNA methyltransferase [Gemmatimonadota bacterium]|nr:DNA methyltransferase [Gemmatimonadota bacterium]
MVDAGPDHPTRKPEKLLAKLILASTDRSGFVFGSPVLGSGTMAVVSKKLGRKFLGVEQVAEYCCWALKRLDTASLNPSIQGYADGVFWERNSRKGQERGMEVAARSIPKATSSSSNEQAQSALRSDRWPPWDQRQGATGEYSHGPVWPNERPLSVLLRGFRHKVQFRRREALLKYGPVPLQSREVNVFPFLVCLVTPSENFVLLANTTSSPKNQS